MIRTSQLTSAVAASVLLLATGSAFAGILTSGSSLPSNGQSIPAGGNVDPLLQFTLDLGTVDASALLNATGISGGNYWATSGTLTVTGGTEDGTYNLISGGPGNFNSPSGAFYADNVLYPGSNPYLDGGGLLFGNGAGLEINVFANNSGDNCPATEYCFWSHDSSGYNVTLSGTPSSVSLSTVPEPASLALFGIAIALLGAGVGMRRRGLS